MNPTLAYRKRIYDRYASQFKDSAPTFDQQAATRWGKGYAWYLRNWLPADQDARILDVACGDGKLLHFFKAHGYQSLRGVDISPEQADLARQVVSDVTQGDALSYLRQHEQSFDLITGMDIIEHLYKDEVLDFLDGCFNALRPGGRLILQTPNAATPWGSELRYGDFTHETCFQEISLLNLLGMCGFTSTEARELGPVPWGYSLRSTARCVAWRLIRLGLKAYCLAETGSSPSVLTRVFLTSGRKR